MGTVKMCTISKWVQQQYDILILSANESDIITKKNLIMLHTVINL